MYLTTGKEGLSGPSNVPVLRLDQLVLKDELGEGCFSSVWFAKDNYGQDVAVKIFDIS